jgi:hypothetical protein
MKNLIVALAAFVALAVPAGASNYKPARHPKPRPTIAHIMACAPRIDGIDGYFCAETPAGSSTVVASVLFAKTGDSLIGVRQIVRRRVDEYCSYAGQDPFACHCIEWIVYGKICRRWNY